MGGWGFLWIFGEENAPRRRALFPLSESAAYTIDSVSNSSRYTLYADMQRRIQGDGKDSCKRQSRRAVEVLRVVEQKRTE